MRRTWLLVAVPVVFAAGGCDKAGDEVATARTEPAPTVTASANAGSDAMAKELEFVACMRKAGIDDMPDPVAGDSSGRSAVIYAIDVMGKGSDMTFQAALDGCQKLLPAPPAEEKPSAESREAQILQAKCMREHGLPEFPDPSADGKRKYIFYVQKGRPAVSAEHGMVVLNFDVPGVEDAAKACLGADDRAWEQPVRSLPPQENR